MIDLSFKIEDNQSLRTSTFQADIFTHWQDIRGTATYPDKRDFRPQKFPRFLPQIAVVSALEGNIYEDRLIGDTVSEVLKLRQNQDPFSRPSDPHVHDMVHGMLEATMLALAPMYFKGKFLPANANPIEFSTLALPFTQNGTDDILDTIMLAFDFSKHSAFETEETAHALL